MGMGVRTLQRRLAEEHTSFAEVLDSARDILAQSYVDGSRRALVEVSTLLGFGSQAAFNHWYRARHGISPSERRRQVAARTA
jgi:transcriptional regulator GlxA family with amidase domain